MGETLATPSRRRRAWLVVALVLCGAAVAVAVAGPPLVRERVAAAVAGAAERHGVRARVAADDVEIGWLARTVTLRGLELGAPAVEGRADVSLELGSWLGLATDAAGRSEAVRVSVGPGRLRVVEMPPPRSSDAAGVPGEAPADRALPNLHLHVSQVDVETPAGRVRDVTADLQPASEAPDLWRGWAEADLDGGRAGVKLEVRRDEIRVAPSAEAWTLAVPGLGPVEVRAADVTLRLGARRASARDVTVRAGAGELRAARLEAALADGALRVTAVDVAVDDEQERLPFSAARLEVLVPLAGEVTRLVVPRLEATVDWSAVAPFVRAHLGPGAPHRGAEPDAARAPRVRPRWPAALEIQAGRVDVAGAGLALGSLKVDAAADHLDLSGELEGDERGEGRVALGWRAAGEGPATLRLEYHGCLPPAPWRALLAENGLTISPGCRDALTLDATLGADEVTFAGRLAVAAWTVQEAHLAAESMADIGFDAAFDGRLRRDLSEGLVRLTSFTSGPLTLSGSLSATRLRDVPVFDLRLDVPSQACDNLLRALPEAMRPDLQGLWLGGTFSLGLRYTVDLARVYAMYDARLAGREEPYTSPLVLEGENLCEVTSSPRGIDVQALNRADFVHRVELEDGRVIEVGPGTSSFAPLADLPATVVQGALATEDLSFYSHRGVNPGLLKTALEMDLHAGRFKYGGSTITQQLVKNLFLTRTKTIARKIEDILLALIVETEVSKDRLLELYLNVIEFGDGVYGIRNASLVYFGKEPRELLPEEAAFLMTCKPAPPDCQRLLDRGAVTPAWRVKVDYVLERLYRRVKVIGEKEYLDARAREVRFLGAGAGAAPAAAPAASTLDLLP